MNSLLMPGHQARKKLDGIQARIATLQAEHRAIEKAPLALEDMRADALAEVQRFSYRHPFVGLDVRSNDRELPSAPAERVLALVLSCLGDDVVVDALMRNRTDALKAASKAHGLPRQQRAARIAEIREQITELSRTEELEVLALEDRGHTIIRRPDIDARLIVALWREHFGTEAAA